MAKELQIVQGDMFLPEEQRQLDDNITAMVSSYKDNKGEINRLVYDCCNALTAGEAAADQLSSKGRFSRIIGNITGSNQALQNKINENQKAAQFAAQQVLKKMAEQQLMSFELISSVNMKLNASLLAMNEDVKTLYQANAAVSSAVKTLNSAVTTMSNELDQLYTGLEKFFRHNRNELVRIETRMDKIERNVNLLTWQNSIEYQEFNGEEYIDMDDAKKLVCLVSDFYDITRGSWSTTDLLLLKSAMAAVDMEPKQKVNYFGILKDIANDNMLQQKLLGEGTISAKVDPAYLMSLGTLQKLDALGGDERYIVSTIVDYMAAQGSTMPEEAIRDDLTQKYMEQIAHVDIDMDVEAFDLMLDFLYTLQQAKEEHLLVSGQEAVQVLPVGEGMPSISDEPVVSVADEQEERLKDAEQLFLDYKLQEAFDAFQALAEEGNGRAMYFLGEFYRQTFGNVIEKDEEKGFDWHRKGVKAGDVLAKLNTAYKYDKDSSERKRIIDDVLEEVTQMAKRGDCFAQSELADVYAARNESSKAFLMIQQSAKAGYWRSQYELGACYYNGRGVVADEENGAKWYRVAAEKGYPVAQNILGNLYYNGSGVPVNKEKAVEWYRKAAEQGHIGAQTSLGVCYKDGQGVSQDDKKAVYWYEKAAKQGGELAQYFLGLCYENGVGVLQSNEKAVYWHKKAATQGFKWGQLELGNCYRDGIGVGQNGYEAEKWYEKAAAQDLAQAQYELGALYADGTLVGRNQSKAVHFFEKAAKAGIVEAQNQLALCYDEGKGVTEDDERAVIWYKQAAEQGYAPAQSNLAMCYEYGEGTECDIEKAIYWYKKAADQGYETAKEAYRRLTK